MKLSVIFVSLVALSGTALCLPRFSLLTGMQCVNCHANPTGGELRNSFGGSDFVDDHLRLIPAHGDSTDYNFNPQLNDYIRLGGDIRFQYLYDGSQRKTTFQSMEGSIYSLLQLFTSTDLFIRYDFANPNYPYEAYGKYKFNSDNSYIKVGAFEPSYGIRLDDHTAYTRGGNFGFLQGIPQVGLFFSPDYWDVGVEVGSRFGDLFITADATNGSGLSTIDFASRKALIGKVEYLMKGNFMLGASGYTSGKTSMFGLQAGTGIGKRLTILGEWDLTDFLPGVPDTLGRSYGNTKSTAGLVEATYFLMNGLSATARFDYFRTVIGGPIYERYIIGADVYPIPHIDIMPQARFNLDNITHGRVPIVEALLQSHIYF